MIKIFYISLFYLLLTLNTQAFAKIEYVDVAAKGQGSNYSEAVNNALSNAIGIVRNLNSQLKDGKDISMVIQNIYDEKELKSLYKI